MAGNIIDLPASKGSFIGSFEIWRLPGGTIYGQLTDMPAAVIEGMPGEVHERMRQIADLFDQAAASMREQAEALKP